MNFIKKVSIFALVLFFIKNSFLAQESKESFHLPKERSAMVDKGNMEPKSASVSARNFSQQMLLMALSTFLAGIAQQYINPYLKEHPVLEGIVLIGGGALIALAIIECACSLPIDHLMHYRSTWRS